MRAGFAHHDRDSPRRRRRARGLRGRKSTRHFDHRAVLARKGVRVGRNRRKFTPEFKAEAVALVEASGVNIAAGWLCHGQSRDAFPSYSPSRQ